MANPDPDEVLKMVEAELALKRAGRGARSFNRNAFRIWSLVLIIGMVVAGLLLLEYMVSQMPHPRRDANPAAQAAAPK